MQGIPAVLNTRHDYDYIRLSEVSGWKDAWLNLLEGRYCVQDNELIEDVNAPIFRLGFTVAEVEQVIAFKGFTNRETEWYTSQPDRYTLVKGKYVEVEGWKAAYKQAQRKAVLESKLSEVDAALAALQNGTFEHNGHNYYLDTLTIIGQTVGVSLLPDGYTRTWKTADKDVDGVSNIYVTLDKAGVLAIAAACMAAYSANWDRADAVKKEIKALHNAGGDVAGYEVVL